MLSILITFFIFVLIFKCLLKCFLPFSVSNILQMYDFFRYCIFFFCFLGFFLIHFADFVVYSMARQGWRRRVWGSVGVDGVWLRCRFALRSLFIFDLFSCLIPHYFF